MKKSYEELISELKEIVRKIEENETGLHESIALYEQGAVILKQCEDLLASAELKITMLGRE